MSEDEGAARALSRQPTPLFDTAPGRRDPDKDRTPLRGLGAHTIGAPLLQTPAMDQEDNRTDRRRRDSGSEERRTLRWERSPSPLADGRHSRSSIPYVTEGPTMNLDGGEDIGHNGVRYVQNTQKTTDNARLLSHDRENQHGIIHPPYDHSDNKNVLGYNEGRNAYPL